MLYTIHYMNYTICDLLYTLYAVHPAGDEGILRCRPPSSYLKVMPCSTSISSTRRPSRVVEGQEIQERLAKMRQTVQTCVDRANQY